MFVCAVRARNARDHEVFRPDNYYARTVAGNKLAIRAEVNGHAGLFLFDTGEGVSTISSQFARPLDARRGKELPASAWGNLGSGADVAVGVGTNVWDCETVMTGG